MITSTVSFAVHNILMSSFRILAPVAHTLENGLPYRNMAAITAQAIKGKINFNTKHLRKGDPLPAYNGKLRIYNMRFCPYAHRTILALNAKQIDYEVVNINLMDKPEWLPSKSTFGKVPSIEVKEGVCIYESPVTVEYIDEAYPQRPLLPKDPVLRAYDKIIVEAAGPLYSIFVKLLKTPENITEDKINAYDAALDYLQEQLKKRGTNFFGGNEPGYTDYMIWPWFERLVASASVDERAKIDPARYKFLIEYINKMFEDPAVKAYLVPHEAFLKIFDSYRNGKIPDYDILLTQ